jgi:hypothetical protein
MATFFTDFFDISPELLDGYGAFNISLVNDLPLFIDPFLLFNSESEQYQRLHSEIIRYMIFLRDKSLSGNVNSDLLNVWYCFREVKQNWLGFSLVGNSGSGLGLDFARALHDNLHRIFADFGEESVTRGSHLEKVCLVRSGVGRDNISDFTTNLIKDFLCRYTQQFAREHLDSSKTKNTWVDKARFNYETEAWDRVQYTLPYIAGDFVILTPKDMLTRDDTWINRHDLINSFEEIPVAIPDAALRAQVFNYFNQVLVRHREREPNKKERDDASAATILRFPQLIDYYIKIKEERGDEASDISAEKVYETEQRYIRQLRELQSDLAALTQFYRIGRNTYEEAHARLSYLKDVIENKGGHRIFFYDGKPLEREKDLQILFRLVWFGTPSDVTTEANDGRGPVDFKISRGAPDKTLVEMKLVKNTHLERNLQNQVPIYQAASDAPNAIKGIIFFTEAEEDRAVGILDKLGILGHKDIVLIDARADNKPSGSKA